MRTALARGALSAVSAVSAWSALLILASLSPLWSVLSLSAHAATLGSKLAATPAATPAATGRSDAGPGEAEGWRMLARAHQAAQSLSYSGTYVHQRGPEVRTLRISHQRSGGKVLEKHENLDGPRSETVRRGEHVMTYLPQQRRILIHDRDPGPTFPGVRAVDARQLSTHYRLRWLGEERVAGRAASAWALEPRDALRYGYRFWADNASGLLLRAQTLSERADVVEQAAFSQLRIGALPPARLAASVRDTQGWRTEDAHARPAPPAAVAAWRAGWLPPGFGAAGSQLRRFASTSSVGEREVLQLLYSDGLAGLSVFIEPWSAERSAQPLQLGAVNMVGKRHGKFWLTIVGEVPMLAVRQVADAIEFSEKAHK